MIRGNEDIVLCGFDRVMVDSLVHSLMEGKLSSKALYYKTTEPFWMNFQQIKFNVCDIFIFLGVWIDKICYWVLSDREVRNNKYLSPQHRGGIEYQIGIMNKNIVDFEQYVVDPSSIGYAIVEKTKR